MPLEHNDGKSPATAVTDNVYGSLPTSAVAPAGSNVKPISSKVVNFVYPDREGNHGVSQPMFKTTY